MLKRRKHTPKASRGAVPKARPARRRLPFVRPVLLVALLGFVGVMVFKLGASVSEAFWQRPVEQVQVEGPFNHVTREEATRLIGRAIDNRFAGLDLEELKLAIEQHSWIDRAVVQRRWPDQLHITIVEEVPIARWGDHGFLNQSGEIIAADQGAGLDSLPRLHGRRAQSGQIMARYQDVSARLRSRGLALTDFWRDELGTWRLSLTGGTRLVLGENDVMNRLQRFLRVYDDYLSDKLAAVARVDLRYRNGLAVAWREEYEVTVQQAEHSGA